MVEIRVATESDLPALCRLLGELFAQELEFHADEANQKAGLTLILQDPSLGCVLVAVTAKRVVGMVSLLYTVSTALGKPVALLEDIVVDPCARGDGIGSLLLRSAITKCRASGFRRITLLTDSANHGAQRLYEREGFQRSSMVAFRMHIE